MRRPGGGDKKNHHTAAAAAVMAATAKESASYNDGLAVSSAAAAATVSRGPSLYGSTTVMHVVANDSDDYYKKLLPPCPPAHGLNGGNKHLESASGHRWMVTTTNGGASATTSVPNHRHYNIAQNDGGEGSSTCGSEEDFKILDNSCEVHGAGYAGYKPGFGCPEVYRALDGVRYIAECTMREEESSKVTQCGNTKKLVSQEKYFVKSILQLFSSIRCFHEILSKNSVTKISLSPHLRVNT